MKKILLAISLVLSTQAILPVYEIGKKVVPAIATGIAGYCIGTQTPPSFKEREELSKYARAEANRMYERVDFCMKKSYEAERQARAMKNMQEFIAMYDANAKFWADKEAADQENN